MVEGFYEIVKKFSLLKKQRDKRFNDFIAFYEQCVNELPIELCNALGAKKINPTVSKGYVMDFKSIDVFWWKERYNTDNFTVLPIETVKGIVSSHCIDIIKELQLEMDSSNFVFLQMESPYK